MESVSVGSVDVAPSVGVDIVVVDLMAVDSRGPIMVSSSLSPMLSSDVWVFCFVT